MLRDCHTSSSRVWPVQAAGAGTGMRPPEAMSASTAGLAPALVLREKRNWLIHMLYVRHEMDECLALIEEQLKECSGLCEYAIYVKGAGCMLGGWWGMGAWAEGSGSSKGATGLCFAVYGRSEV